MKNRKQLFKTSRLLLLIVAVALVLSMGLTACGFLTDATKGATPDDVIINAGSIENNGAKGEADQNSQNFSSNAKVNLSETYGDLLPLYETLTEQEGSAFSLVFNLVGGINIAEINKNVDLRYVVTVSDDDKISMMFLDGNDNVLFSFKDGKINLDGFGMDIGLYQEDIEGEQLPDFAEGATYAIGEILAYLNDFLVDYDSLAQLVPVLFNSMNLDTTGLVMSSQNGEYIFNANCQSLITLLTTYFSDSFDDLIAALPFEIDIAQLLGVENTEASDLELVIAAVDDMFFDGALLSGYVDLNAHLTVTENGFDSSVALVNAFDHDQVILYLGFGGAIEDEIPIEIPEVTALHDIQADIPISLPQSGLEMTIHAIFHTADIFAEEGNDFITATVDMNGLEDVATLVLNDSYFFVDLNALVEIAFPMLGEATDYTYILPFEEGCEVHTILGDLSGFLDDALDFVGFYDLFEDAPQALSFENGDFLGLDVNYDSSVFFVGMTEADLREVLYVAVLYYGRCPEQVFDYEITGLCMCPYCDSWWIDISYCGCNYSMSGQFPREIPSTPPYDDYPSDINQDIESITLNWNPCGIYEGMTEAELRQAIHVIVTYRIVAYLEDDQVEVSYEQIEVYNYGVNINICSYCGQYEIYVCFGGCQIMGMSRIYDDESYNHIEEAQGGLTPGISLSQPPYDPNLIVRLYGEPADECFFEGMTEADLRSFLHVWAYYRGYAPEEIFDYDVDELIVANNNFYYLISIDSMSFTDSGIIPDGNEGLGALLPFLRFEVDPDQEEKDIILGLIGGIVDVYLANQDILENAIQIEDIENGKNIVICLSDSSLVEEGDLLAFVNTFLGLPTGDGFADINGQSLYYFLAETLGADAFAELDGALQMVGGFTLEDLCTNLYLNLTGYLNNNNKLRFGLSLTGADTDPEVDESYLTIGIIEYHAVVTDSAYDAALTVEDIEAANPFDEIVDVLFGCFGSLFGGDQE